MKQLPVTVAYDEAELVNATQESQADLEYARGQSIASADDFAQWSEDAKVVARQIKEVKAAKATVLAPLQVAIDAVNKLFAPRERNLVALDGLLRTELERYGLAKKAEAREQLRLAGEAANRGDSAGVAAALTIAAQAAPSKTGVTIKEVWTAEVFAPDLVPCDWRIPDEKRINKHARETPANRTPGAIGGVRYTLVGSSTVRSKL